MEDIYPSSLVMSCVCFKKSPTWSFSTRIKPLKVTHSDKAVRSLFENWSDVFLTPSSTLETPSSWPLRHALTVPRPTCGAGNVVSFFCFASHSIWSKPYPSHSGTILFSHYFMPPAFAKSPLVWLKTPRFTQKTPQINGEAPTFIIKRGRILQIPSDNSKR